MPVPFRINYKEPITSEIAQLPVKFIWLTTWNHQAVKIWEPLTGIRSLEVLPYNFKLREFRTHKTKYEILKAHQAANPSPFIWLDDVATKHYNPADWENNPEHLVIRPQKRYGITMDHVERMKEFIVKG